MLEFVVQYFRKDQDHNAWRNWQLLQDPQHFEKSNVFRHFISQRPNILDFLKNRTEYSQISSLGLELYRPYVEYCFGDFEVFVINPSQEDLSKYVLLMIDLYDICKGYTRLAFGDAPFISVLRNFIAFEDVNILLDHTWLDPIYDYNDFHAHTVAYFSLSSLIALFVRNYVGRLYPGKNIPYIKIERCRKAYHDAVFGVKKPLQLPEPSLALDIPPNQNQPSPFGIQGKTWPRMNNARCPECNRLTEGSWGKFNLCIDCYVNKKCVHCNADANGERDKKGWSVCNFHKSVDEKFGDEG